MMTALALRKALRLVGVGQVGLPVVLAEHLIHALLDIFQGEVSADLSLYMLILGECGTPQKQPACDLIRQRHLET